MNLQTTGYVKPHGKIIKILYRLNGVKVSIRLRKSGTDGRFFEDESVFLESEPEIVEKLKRGEVVKI